jgi:hypothetical protein
MVGNLDRAQEVVIVYLTNVLAWGPGETGMMHWQEGCRARKETRGQVQSSGKTQMYC